jgi:6-phospho-beta-glucosidase
MNKPLTIVVIGGGSSYTSILVDSLLKEDLLIKEIWLVDVKSGEEKLNNISDFIKRMLKRRHKEIQIHTTMNRKEAFVHADYVIAQFRVGGLEGRQYDETIPGKYNLLGHESIGIGGLFQALRTVPLFFDIIKDMKELCPDAWLLNVTNPTGIISEAIFRYGDFQKYIGISTIPNSIIDYFKQTLQSEKSDFIPFYIGLYQMSFIKRLYYQHKNVLPHLLDNMKDQKIQFDHHDSLNFDEAFIKQLAAYPSPYLRYYYFYSEMLEHYQQKLHTQSLRIQEVFQIEEQLQHYYKTNDTIPTTFNRGGQYYSFVTSRVISSIENDRRDYHVLIVQNNRVTPDFPEDGAIEVTCRVSKYGVNPVHIGGLPIEFKGILQHQKAYEELVVDAIVEKSFDKALFALLNHPFHSSSKNVKKAFLELKEVHAPYLTYYED